MTIEIEWSDLAKEIASCNRCPRLREYDLKVARDKRRQFQNESYYGLPLSGFGDPHAKVFMIGLAPSAHGGNRTGRMFTGDNSGLWLYRALFKAGFANQAESFSRQDGLILNRCFISTVARCAPPQNQLKSDEILNCRPFLKQELALLKEIRVFVAFGQVALKGLWSALPETIKKGHRLPPFQHGRVHELAEGRYLITSYHPSQQNTFTKRLTEPMFDSIFEKVKEFI